MSVSQPRSAPATRPFRPAARVALGQAMQLLGLASAAVWLVLAVAWSDHGEGGGYATPVAAVAAMACVLIGWALRRLLVGD